MLGGRADGRTGGRPTYRAGHPQSHPRRQRQLAGVGRPARRLH